LSMPPKILIVDDDPSIRQVVQEILDLEGYQTAVAEDGAQALSVLMTYPARLILLDMRMPVMDGWTFVRRLRDQGNTTPIVVMTAASDASSWAAEVEAAGVLPKPFELDEILTTVERHFAAA
jgi:two-component system, chemotaxis family, chemotaxis protein CheY